MMLFLLFGVLSLVMVAAEAYGQTVLPVGYQIPQQHSNQPLSNLNYYGQVQGYQMQPPNSQQYAFHKGQTYPSGNVGQPRLNPSRYAQPGQASLTVSNNGNTFYSGFETTLKELCLLSAKQTYRS